MTRPFRFAVQLRTASARSEWREKVKRTEDLGYDLVAAADHVGEGIAPLQALTAAADASATLRLATLVLDNDFRHPVVLASEAAALDVLSDGRFELGLGAGWLGRDYERSGIPFDRPGVRVDRLEESTAIVASALAKETVTFTGRHYTVGDFEIHPKPVQDRVPLLLGGGGRRLLRLAARRADIVGVMPTAKADGTGFDQTQVGESHFARKIDYLRSVAGPRFADIELSLLVQAVEIADDPRRAAEKLASEWEEPVDPIFDMPFVLMGPVPAMVEKLLRLREEIGFSYFTVFEKDMDAFASVITKMKDA